MEAFDKYVGQVFDRRYKILRIIGIGGMAVVFEAHDIVMNRTVAVKMLKDEISNDTQSVRRFINESKAVSMLSHPNIVRVYDVSFKDDLKYIVMERVEGITLKNYMQKKGALPFREVISYTEQILKALEHAHSKGIIHRDIKPQNIMLLKNGKIKVTDFGIAKLPNAETVTMTDKAIGTVYYISPEQASGKPIDPRSDLYSLGIVMYEMTTGQLPFTADSPVSVALMQVNDQPRRPRDIVPDVPQGLEQIILGAMEKHPERRFQNAAQMLRYITQLRSDPTFVFKTHRAQQKPQENGIKPAEPEKHESARPARRTARQSRSMFPIILGVTLSFLIVFFISAYFIVSKLIESEAQTKAYVVVIPPLVGAVYDDNLAAQFNPDVYSVEVSYEYNANYSENTIISQKPASGDQRKVIPGSQLCSIEIVVSKGAKSVVMDDYVATPYLETKIKLEKLGLIVDLYPIQSSMFSLGYVISTEPAAGQTVNLGSRVKVYYSSGQNVKNIKVPDFINMTEAEAYAAMKDGNTGKMLLTLGGVTYESSNTVEEGRIIWQSRDAGTSVAQGSKIYFTVSTGRLPDPVTDLDVTDEFDTEPESPEGETTPPDETLPEETTEETPDTVPPWWM